MEQNTNSQSPTNTTPTQGGNSAPLDAQNPNAINDVVNQAVTQVNNDPVITTNNPNTLPPLPDDVPTEQNPAFAQTSTTQASSNTAPAQLSSNQVLGSATNTNALAVNQPAAAQTASVNKLTDSTAKSQQIIIMILFVVFVVLAIAIGAMLIL